ncbi:hypothetical protein P3L10_011323 [Capsicum annuum]
MPDAFTDLKRITKSHIPAENVPIRIDVPKGPSTSVIANESKARLKRGRPLCSKDRNPRKRKTNGINEPETQENEKLSINSSDVETNLNRSEIIVDHVFTYNVATKIMQDSEDLEPRSVTEYRQRNVWPKWQETIQSKLNSLSKHEVFGPIAQTPNGVKPLAINGSLCEKEMRNMKYKGIRHALLHKDFHKGLVSIMTRHIHQLWT